MSLTETDKQVIGSYAEIRAAAQDLDRALALVLDELERSDSTGRDRMLAQNLPSLTALRDACGVQVEKSLETIERTSETDPEQRSWAGDHAVHVRHEWLSVTLKWPTPELPPDAASDAFKKVSKHLDKIVFWCASLTLTPRLADILENVRIGKAISIEAVVGLELPRDPELRATLIREVVDQDGVLECGYLDKDAALIFRVAATRGQQRWSVVRIVGAVVAGFGLVVGACFISPGEGWPFERSTWLDQLIKCVLLTAGALVHLVIQGVTLSRRAKSGLSRPWNDWITWLNAHETQAFWGVASLFIAFFFLSFTMKGFEWQTAFFAGYSIDSITDVLLDRFEQMTTARSKKLTEVVQGTTPATAP